MEANLYTPPNCPSCKSANTAHRNSNLHASVVDCWDCCQTFLEDGTLLDGDDEPIDQRDRLYPS